MKLTEMILAMEKWKGTEANFLMTKEDFVKSFAQEDFESKENMADTMLALGRTLGEEKKWSELYYSTADKSVAARFCNGEKQLIKFLKGFYNGTDQKVLFDEERCSDACINKLAEYGMDTKGNITYDSLSFTKIDTVFRQGQILQNFNGSDYRVMEKLTDKNLLLMDNKTGNFVVALGTELCARHPRGVEPTEENSFVAIEWGNGVYLGCTPSTIDFRQLRQEYGREREIEDIYQYREMLKDRFRLYARLNKDELADDVLKENVMYIAYEEFGTHDFERFYEKLQAGCYDSGFMQVKETKKEQSR